MLDRQPLQLNDDFKFALDTLEKTSRSLFITGRAGTGKSTLLRLFQQTSRKKMVVLAPTGVAALNVQGQTIHSFFGFPTRILTPQEASRKVTQKNLVRLYQNMETLVVDEISMVRADLLDAMDKFLRINRENFRPFGGVQVVFFGDMFQLPPVVTQEPLVQNYFSEYYESPYFFSGKIMADEAFDIEMLELRKVYRQESRMFLRLLESVRINEVDFDDMADLNERYVPHFQAPTNGGYITLCARNATVDRINQLELGKLTTPTFKFIADIQGNFEAHLYPTEPVLALRQGTQVMFVKNDPERAFVNGTIGTVTEISQEKIKVEVEEFGGKRRTIEVPRLEWEIRRYKSGDSGEIEHEKIGSFIQYPLKLAWAITIHKSQGKTFDKVIIDLGSGAFEHGQLYVALSRCRTLEGIVLRQPIRSQDVITDPRVVDFYQRQFR